MLRIRSAFFTLSILGAMTCLAQDPDDVVLPQVMAGKAQFAQLCGFCHGRDGRGNSGPDLIRSTLVNHDVKADLIGEVVRSGRPAKGMPAFQLPDSEIQAIAAFLHHEASGAASVARRVPADYPLEKLLVGKAIAGKAFFDANCRTCHSPDGDFAHIASKYKPFELQTRIAFPGGEKRHVVVLEISGKKVEGEEVYSDEFYVTLRDKDGWTHSYKRGPHVTSKDPLAEHERLLKQYTDQNVHDLFAYLEGLK